MKRLIFAVLSFCLIFSLIGCSGVTQGSSQMSAVSQSVTASQAVTDESEITVSQDESQSEEISSEEKEKYFNIKLSFVGDVMLASMKNQTTKGSFNEYANKKEPEYFFEKVKPIFAEDDFTTVNLENVFTDNELEESEKDHDPAYWFRSKTANTKILTAASVEGVSLANNHTYDYGKEGYRDTIDAVKKAGLDYGTYEKILYYEKNGFKIAVICYGLWRPNGVPIIVNLLKKASEKSDYQIVFFHGGKERIYKPEEWKQTACRELVDNGADLVIGNHPHVLQPREIYEDVEIIYSLGNFCFGGNKKPRNKTIIYQMELVINEQTLEVSESNSNIIPCYVYTGKWNNYQPSIIENKAEKNQVLDFMNGKVDNPGE